MFHIIVKINGLVVTTNLGMLTIDRANAAMIELWHELDMVPDVEVSGIWL